MAVARMSRVEVVGYRPVLDDVVEALQRAGVLQVEAAPEGLETEALAPDDERRRRVDEYAADARFARDFLARYHTPTQPFATFVSEKVHISTEDFERLGDGAALLELYRACDDIADQQAAGQRERTRLAALVRDLEPWRRRPSADLAVDRHRARRAVRRYRPAR